MYKGKGGPQRERAAFFLTWSRRGVEELTVYYNVVEIWFSPTHTQKLLHGVKKLGGPEHGNEHDATKDML